MGTWGFTTSIPKPLCQKEQSHQPTIWLWITGTRFSTRQASSFCFKSPRESPSCITQLGSLHPWLGTSVKTGPRGGWYKDRWLLQMGSGVQRHSTGARRREDAVRRIHKRQVAMHKYPTAPFADNDKWELARWLIKNVTQGATEEFLKMKGVYHTAAVWLRLVTHCSRWIADQIHSRYNPSYKSNYTLLKKVDELPTGPEWMCRIIQTVGKLLDEDGKPIIEEHELWIHDPIEGIRQLIGNPAFQEYMAYAPEKTYTDKNGRNRQYDKMWTGDWWWKVQVQSVNARNNKVLKHLPLLF